MNDEDLDLLEFLQENGVEATLEAYGLTDDELMNRHQALDDEMTSQGYWAEEDDVTMDENTVIDEATVTAANDAYENTGKLDFNPEMDPEREAILNGMVGSTGKANAIKGMFSKLGNNLFASKALKVNQKANRGATGEVVKGTSRTLKDSNLRPSIATKTADRYKSATDKIKKDNAVKAGTVAGAATAIGLSGNRNENGDFEKVDLGRKEPVLIDEFDNEANNRAMIKGMNKEDGFLQRQMRKKSTTGNTEKFGQEDGRIVKQEQAPSKKEGNQFGYHQQPGQNFWTVNNEDAYWDTHEMGTGNAWSDADVKKAPSKELDWSSWFN